MDYLPLYSRNCKVCSLLDKEETRKFKCTPESGNTLCPAGEIQFVVIGKAKKLALAVLQARKSSNFEEEAKLLQQVTKLSPEFQHKFREFLNDQSNPA